MSFVGLSLRRRQAAITGRVVDARTASPVAGAEARITASPAAFQAILATLALRYGAAWGALGARPDVSRTSPDGSFHFGDLPDGAYQITVSAPSEDRLYGEVIAGVTVTHAIDGAVTTAPLDLALPPTGAAGAVSALAQNQTTPLPMARVRVRGSGERAYSDSTGQYYLTGADPGTRTLEISAPGYQLGTIAVSIQKGVVAQAPSITLIPAP